MTETVYCTCDQDGNSIIIRLIIYISSTMVMIYIYIYMNSYIILATQDTYRSAGNLGGQLIQLGQVEGTKNIYIYIGS